MQNLTLGSLFDGSGGFPLGGLLAGITPVWASEVEPFAVRVTTKRMPFIHHYGDVSKMNGAEIEPVDIITFGSPCQDMSVAGKRAGLDGSRSNLFYEAVRIINEMRCATNGQYPRYAVWENVPGAFSSNKGEDFRCVLQSLCSVKNPEVFIPKSQKWTHAGSIVGDDFSLAWRVLDAQFWGVPQRRKRIYLVADFADVRAPEILFDSEGLSRYSSQGFSAWQRAAGSFADSIGTTGIGFDGYNGQITDDSAATLGVNCGTSTGRNGVVLNDQGGSFMQVSEDVVGTLRAMANHPPCVMEAAGFCTEHSAQAQGIGYEEEKSPTLRASLVPATIALENHPMDGRIRIEEDGTVQTLTERMGTGGMNVPLLLKIRSGCEGGGKGSLIQEDKSATLSCNNDQTLFEPKSWDGGDTAPTLTRNNAGGSQRMPDKDNFNCVLQPYGIASYESNAMKSDNPRSGVYEADTARTIDISGGNPACNQGGIAVVAFAQNQREEVRDLGDKASALAAEPGIHQQTYVVDQGGGKSSVNISEELSPTLAETHGGAPAICLQGSMIGRKDENGPQGDGINEDVSFTLNAIDRHAVYALTTGATPKLSVEKAPSLLERDYKDAPVVNAPPYGIDRAAYNQGQNAAYKPAVVEELQPTLVAKGPGAVAKNECGYSVRRLTPVECARLQGFPDWWCMGLATEDPIPEEIAFWTDVFETHRRITNPDGKPKNEKQIIRWLKKPYSDAAEYKLWGNGVALPCVFFVLAGIQMIHEKEKKEHEV